MSRWFIAGLAAFAVLAPAARAHESVPVAWDFVDTSLCGFPVQSVGEGAMNAHFVFRGSQGPLGLTSGPLTITATNLLTGASVKVGAPSPTRFDAGSGSFSLLGRTLGVGIGLPYATFRGSMTVDTATFEPTTRGTFVGYDLCRALDSGAGPVAPRATAPPWWPPAAPLAGAYADGLVPILGSVRSHDHAHLDLFVDGEPVEIPAGIGIVDPVPSDQGVDSAAGIYSPLHTHRNDGILHLEPSTEPLTMTIGHMFDVWQVRLDEHCLGHSCGGLRSWVNGVEWTGDPRTIPLTPHDQIVLASGSQAPDPVPSRYEFPIGY